MTVSMRGCDRGLRESARVLLRVRAPVLALSDASEEVFGEGTHGVHRFI